MIWVSILAGLVLGAFVEWWHGKHSGGSGSDRSAL